MGLRREKSSTIWPNLVDAGAIIEMGKTQERTGLGEENSILWGHVKFEKSLRHCVEMPIRHQLDSRRYLILELRERGLEI